MSRGQGPSHQLKLRSLREKKLMMLLAAETGIGDGVVDKADVRVQRSARAVGNKVKYSHRWSVVP